MNLSEESDYDADTDHDLPIPSTSSNLQNNPMVSPYNLRSRGYKRGVEDLSSPSTSPNRKRFREESESDSDSDATIEYEYTPTNKGVKRQLSDSPSVSPERKRGKTDSSDSETIEMNSCLESLDEKEEWYDAVEYAETQPLKRKIPEKLIKIYTELCDMWYDWDER